MTEARSRHPSHGPGREVDPAHLARELADAVLAGAGRADVLRALRRATGRHVRLLSADGMPLATTDGGAGLPAPVAEALLTGPAGSPLEALDGHAVSGLPVRAGTTLAGLLLTVGPVDLRVQELAESAVTALLIDSVRGGGAVAPARPLTPGEVVAALRGGAVTGAVYSAAAGLGLDLRTPPVGAVLHYSGSRLRAWATALTWVEHPVQQAGRMAWTVVADDSALLDLQRRLRLMIGDDGGDEGIVAAVGSRPESAVGLARSFTEAGRLLYLARARRLPVVTFERCGVVQLLLSLPRPRLETYVEAHLGPIRQRPELMATLRAWLAESGSRQSVSEQLHLHRNSVGYRVRQLKSLLGVDPLVPATSAELQLALAALDLLAADDARSGCGDA